MGAKSAEIQKLRRLRDQPEEQLAYACSLLTKRQKRDVLMAALPVLENMPTASNRERLLPLIDHFSADGGLRDAGCYLRRLMFAALRPIATPADADLLLRAVATYEFLPPAFTEEAVLLRTAALVVLNEVEPELAAYHAARLLVDPFVEAMSGEPAITAVRVLASQGESLSVYQYAMRDPTTALADVISESLRHLTDLPVRLVPGIVAHHGASEDPVIQIGLFDLLLQHRGGPQELDFVAASIAAAKNIDVYRYLTVALAASGRPELVALLMATAQYEQRSNQIELLLEALALLPERRDLNQLIKQLEQRL